MARAIRTAIGATAAAALGAALLTGAARTAAPGSGASGRPGTLTAASADSAQDAWAVGTQTVSGRRDTLILHWTGTAWSQVTSPSPGTSDVLTGVSADSAQDAWAVGYYRHGGATDTLILHWNGTAWSQMTSPSPGAHENQLSGVSADSGTDAWAVGTWVHGRPAHGNFRPLILRWNGTSWSQVPGPGLHSSDSFLAGVSTVSGSDAWAAGSVLRNVTLDTLVLHWNGTAWSRVPSASPSPPGGQNRLGGVSAVPGNRAWAAGSDNNLTTGPLQTLVLGWNGKSWPRQSSPEGAGGSSLHGVSALSGTDAFAVGDYRNGSGPALTMILRWNGTSWSQATSPSPGHGNDVLNGVSAVSAGDAFAVGYVTSKSVKEPLILHWNGSTWRVQ
jgi:hypothetical protein